VEHSKKIEVWLVGGSEEVELHVDCPVCFKSIKSGVRVGKIVRATCPQGHEVEL